MMFSKITIYNVKKFFFYLKIFFLYSTIWICFSYNGDFHLILIGFFLSFFLILLDTYINILTKDISFSFLSFLKYSIILLLNVLKSTFKIIFLVLNDFFNKKSGILNISFYDLNLKKYQKIMIANFITMTPGTFVISIYGNNFLVHFINISDKDEVKKLCYNLLKKS